MMNTKDTDIPASAAGTSSKANTYWASLVSPSVTSNDPKKEASKSSGAHTNIKEIEKLVGFVSEQVSLQFHIFHEYHNQFVLLHRLTSSMTHPPHGSSLLYSLKYDCVHNNFAGTLYAGPLALVWLGRIFFFEWTVILKWEDIVQVQKRNDGLRLIVQSKAVYDFVNLFNAERAWASLVSLHNDTIIDQPRRGPTPRQVTRSLRRMNSDPMRMSFVFENPDDELRFSSSRGLPKRRETLSRSATVPMEEKMDQVPESLLGQKSHDIHSKQVSLEQQWSSIVEASFAETAVEKHELSCSLDTFMELFVGDDAKYSLPTFMKESGDEEIHCSLWTAVGDDGVMKSRTIEYTHPINAPMAPPMARARKEQSYKKFADNGIVLETKTYVSDVPMTDCFYVADQILVEPVDDRTVNITMSFELEFVKSTMFKAIIMRTTKGEFESFMQRLANFMSKSLGQVAIVTPVIPAPPTPAKEPTALAYTMVPNITVGLLCFVLALQFWILIDLGNVKSTLHQLQANKPMQCIGMMGL